MKHIFIINPVAGKGDSARFVLPRVIKYVKTHGDNFEIHRSLNKQEIGSYVKTRASVGDPIRFYAVGGDGTVCDVVNGMAEFGNAELAVIPCGSGNDFARNFSHKEKFFDLDAQTNGKIEYIDVIKYNDSYSMNMLNVGADSEVVSASILLRKQGMSGSASYARAALSIIPKGPEYEFEYVTGPGSEKKAEKFMLVAMGNGKYCGGGFKSCPNAKINDGLLDVACIRAVQGWKLAPLLLKYHQGTYINDEAAKPYYEYVQTPEFWLRPISEATISVDGEVEQCPELHVKVLPHAIKFVVPKGSKLL